MKTDEICNEYEPKKVGLVLKLIDDEGSQPDVLIEGSGEALKMLAALLLAVANDPDNDGFSISPFGAGKVHFSEDAEMGVYIHRIDKY